MLCPACGKESSNVRVCGFCQTPFPTDDSARSTGPRRTRASGTLRTPRDVSAEREAGDPRIAMARRSNQLRILRWGGIALLAAFTVGFWFMGRERSIPVGVALPNLIEAPMSPAEAAAFLATVATKATVEESAGALTVRLTAAAFPIQRAGQLAFAQQYTRADEIVSGRKRDIFFVDPQGSNFAKAEPERGAFMTR